MLLQSKNSVIFRAETAIIRTENLWSSLRMTEHRLTLMKISEHYWKCMITALNICENLYSSLKRPNHSWTTRKISARVWKSLNITENYYFDSQTVLKFLLALVIAEGSLTYVLSAFDQLHLRKTPNGKGNKLTIKDKIKHTSGQNLLQSEHHLASGAFSETDLDVISPSPQSEINI